MTRVNIQQNIQLQTLNTMATPALARWFVVVQNEHEIPEVLAYCQQQECDYLVLGEGSNSVFTSNFAGVIIANRIGGAGPIPNLFASAALEVLTETSEFCDIQVGAGVVWHQLVEQTLQNGLYGLERLALIPGLVGAAPIQNIGAYGCEVGDLLTSVRVYDTQMQAFVDMPASDCEFAYRDSLFKRQAGRFIISKVTFRLQKNSSNFSLEALYPALREPLNGVSDIQAIDVFQAVCRTRQAKLPDPQLVPNAGSFFKNPIVTIAQERALKQHFPNLVSYPAPEGKKLAAAWLIEQAGLKGVSGQQGVGCYAKQALVLVNPDKVEGANVLAFAQHVQHRVKEMFDVTLEIEPNIF